MGNVFLSYAREDRACAQKLAQALETAGHEVWWDRRLDGGEEFSAEIEAALGKCDVVLVAWSKESVKSIAAMLGTRPRMRHFDRSIVWNWRNPSGGRVPSTRIGISRPSDSFSASAISFAKRAPPPTCRSHQTVWPLRSSARASAAATDASSRA